MQVAFFRCALAMVVKYFCMYVCRIALFTLLLRKSLLIGYILDKKAFVARWQRGE